MANLALPGINGRQYSMSALFVVNMVNFQDNGVAVPFVKLPPNAVVTGGYIDVLVAYDSTTATVNVGDVGLATRYISGVSLKTVGKTLLTLPDYIDVAGDEMLFVPAITGTPTVGSFLVHVSYSILNRAHENQPN